MHEHRRYVRAPLGVSVEIVPKGSSLRIAGTGKDISLGGMFIETAEPQPFGAQIVVYLTFPGERAPFGLPAVVRWTRADGMGVQFGLVGARETHAITRVTRGSSSAI